MNKPKQYGPPLRKLYRRKRKYEGKHWRPKRHTDQSPSDIGLLCKKCGRWRLWKELGMSFEGFGEAFKRVWYCEFCGSVLREEVIPG